MNMPWVTLPNGESVQVPVGEGGVPDWGAVGDLSQILEPYPSRDLPKDKFIERIGLARLTNIVAEAKTDATLEALIIRVQTAGETINLDASDVILGLSLLVDKGILTEEEAENIRR